MAWEGSRAKSKLYWTSICCYRLKNCTVSSRFVSNLHHWVVLSWKLLCLLLYAQVELHNTQRYHRNSLRFSNRLQKRTKTPVAQAGQVPGNLSLFRLPVPGAIFALGCCFHLPAFRNACGRPEHRFPSSQ